MMLALDSASREDPAAVADALNAFVNAPPGTRLEYNDVVSRLGLEGAATFFDGVASQFSASSDAEYRLIAFRAFDCKGIALSALGRRSDALSAWSEAVERAAGLRETNPAEVARALFNKAAMLGKLDRFQEAIVVYDQVIDTFGSSVDPAARYEAVTAISGKAGCLIRLRHPGEGVRVGMLLARYEGDEDPRIQAHLREQGIRARLIRRLGRVRRHW